MTERKKFSLVNNSGVHYLVGENHPPISGGQKVTAIAIRYLASLSLSLTGTSLNLADNLIVVSMVG